jgi:hypothetical protein
MAEENIENQEQSKMNHSLMEALQAFGELKRKDKELKKINKAQMRKEKKEARDNLRAQAKAQDVSICAKYKLGKEKEAEEIEKTLAEYEEQFKSIVADFEQKEEAINTEKEKNDTEYEELLIKESEIRKAYRQEKQSKEYKEFIAKNRNIDKEIKRYEAMKDDENANIDPEALNKIISGLKELASKNPLNSYAEDLKKCEDRKKAIIEANKELERKIEEIENKFEKSWDELDVKKNQALVATKNKEQKPTLRQRLSNLITSQEKRAEKARIESKRKSEETIEKVKKAAGFIGKGIAGAAVGAKNKVQGWHENNKQKTQERINSWYASIKENYQATEEKIEKIREGEDKVVAEGPIPVPEAKAPIVENGGVEIEIVEEKTEARRPGSTTKAEPATHEDR